MFIDSLLNNTHFNEVLNGFSVYTDVISYAPNTIWSLLSTLTGKHIETNAEGEQREGLVEKYKNNTITSVLSMHGYQVDTFNIIDSMGGDNIINNNTHRVLPIEFVEATQPGAYYVAMLRILPKTLSKRLVDGISRILDKLGEKLGLHVILTDKLGRFFGSDIYAFRKMYGEAYLVNEPVFKFHHYLFTHQPIRLDADCSYLANTQQSFKAAQAELTCVLDEFSNFIVKLKKMGIYDQSLIILTSDHGYESNIQPSRWNGKTYKGGYTNENGLWSASRYWTVLAMKPMGANNTLYFDPQPASLLDIVPTIAGFANIGFCHRVECDGNDLLSRSDPENSDRKAMFFIGGRRHIPDVHFDTRVFQTLTIQGDAYTGIKEAMESISDKKWLIDLPPNEALVINLGAFVTHKYRQQSAQVLLNGYELGTIVIDVEEQMPLDFIFELPGDAVETGDINKLVFHIFHPISPQTLELSNDTRKLGLGFYSMMLR